MVHVAELLTWPRPPLPVPGRLLALRVVAAFLFLGTGGGAGCGGGAAARKTADAAATGGRSVDGATATTDTGSDVGTSDLKGSIDVDATDASGSDAPGATGGRGGSVGGTGGRGGAAGSGGGMGGAAPGGTDGGTDSGNGVGNGCVLHGTATGLYTDGQGPGTIITATQARQRLQLLSPFTLWLRFYSSLSGYTEAACIAKKELGKKVALGASLGRDAAGNERELQGLIAAANQGCVDIAVVGSETLLRGDQTPAALITLIRRVKDAVPPAVQVATADVYDRLTADVIAAEDVVLAHIYPFWENVPPRYAVAVLHARYAEMKVRAGAKPVVVAETGWPSAGRADATPELAATHLVQLASWSRATGAPTFVFSGFDEMWKTNEGAVGPFWGYLTAAGAIKPGMERALTRCEDSPDVWSGTALVGGAGTPAIVFTTVPPRGATTQLEGRVEHVRPVEQHVAVYILVGGAWWSKPTSQAPASRIWPDGTFQVTVVTGGNDAQATELRAYLLPVGTAAPVATGTSATLPAMLSGFPVAQAAR